MKKRKFLYLLLPVLFLLGACSREKAYQTYSSSGTVSVVLNLGTQAPVVPGRKISVLVRADGDYAAPGNTVVLTVPTGSGGYYSYRKPLAETGGGKAEAVFAVPVSFGSSQLAAEIRNERDDTIYSRTSTYQFSDSASFAREIFAVSLGTVLDPSVWNASYTQGNELVRIRTASADPSRLSDQADLFEGFDLLVLGQEADTLSEGQKNGILAWQEKGGCVLFASGAESALRFGESLASETATYRFSGTLTVTGYRSERGSFWVMERAQFLALQNPDAVISLLEVVCRDAIRRTETEKEILKLQNQYVDARDGAEVADTRLFYGILLLYVLVLLPGGYLLLRRFDRMQYFRQLAVITAAAVCAVIWLAGRKTRFSEPFLNRTAVFCFGDEGVEEYSLVSIQAPYSRPFSVTFQPEYQVSAEQHSETWQKGSYSSYDSASASVTRDADGTHVSMEKVMAFSPRYFALTGKKAGSTPALSVSERDEGRILFVNHTGMDLEDVLPLYGDEAHYAAEWKAGEVLPVRIAGSTAGDNGIASEEDSAETKKVPALPQPLSQSRYVQAYEDYLSRTDLKEGETGLFCLVKGAGPVQKEPLLPEHSVCFLEVRP